MLPALPVVQAVGLDEGFGCVFEIDSVSGLVNFATIGPTSNELVNFIYRLLQVILSLLAIVAVAALIYGGFRYLTALGDEDKVREAKRIILYTIIGLLIVGASALVVNVVIGIIAVGAPALNLTKGVGTGNCP